jgi:hypothetical protein
MVDNSNQKLKTTLRKRGRDEGRLDPEFALFHFKKLKLDDVTSLRMAGVLDFASSMLDELNFMTDGSIKIKFK